MPPSARRPPYLAHLRVFEPVAYLPGPVRERWTRYAAYRPSRRDLEAAAFAESVRRLAARPPVPLPTAESRDALLLDVDGELYVCPLQPQLQAWHRLGGASAVTGAGDGSDEDEGLVPVGALGAVVPVTLREQAIAELAAHTESGGEVRLFTLTWSWQVPLAWFVPFDASERHLELDGDRSLRYLTPMSAARRRSARGLRAARELLGDADVVDELEQVGRWLEDFDPRSVVELDYGGLVDLLGDVHLRGDDSASDVAEGLAALAEKDTTAAAAAYQRLRTRWQRVQLLARSS